MIATTYAPALTGINGQLVAIECDVTNGLPGLTIVGLGDKTVEEARDRLRSALKNSGFSLPPKRITVNLAPADLPKDCSGYDLGMALAILGATGQLDTKVLRSSLLLGELALNGNINPVRGRIIAAQLASTNEQFNQLFLPTKAVPSATLVRGAKIFGVSSLMELYEHLCGQKPLSPAAQSRITAERPTGIPDLALIYGQPQAKRALEIAGNHNLLLTGPAGTGKTLLAKALPGIIPPPTTEEIAQITSLHSLVTSEAIAPITTRPFRAPHHTASGIALIGGGSRPRPGEISLSHGGILFMDELPEFQRSVLEVLRQPLEDGVITIARAAGSLTFPARFMLVGTCNPCPCGYYGTGRERCRCTPGLIARYQHKISGPLLDRIDLVVEVTAAKEADIIAARPEESSKLVAARVAEARQTKANRSAVLNAQLSNSEVSKHCKLNNETICVR